MRKEPGSAYDKRTLPWSFVTQIFHGHGGDRKTFEAMTSTYAIGILGSVGSL